MFVNTSREKVFPFNIKRVRKAQNVGLYLFNVILIEKERKIFKKKTAFDL